MRINGVIKVSPLPPALVRQQLIVSQGFDEFMNLVIDDAEEVFEFNKKPGKEVKPSRELGECCLRLASARLDERRRGM